MKYFTKEWYELCSKTTLHLALEEEKQAEVFSEGYFQQLYNAGLESWLDLQEEVASLMKKNESMNANDNNEASFNKEKEIEKFYDIFIYNQEQLKKKLPDSILKQIADLRVFTLDKATKTVINAVAKFCKENERSVTTTGECYIRYLEKSSNILDQEIIENFRFHDCMITKSVQKDTSITLFLDNSGGFTDIDEVAFNNFTIIKQEGSLDDSWWLYEELYRVDDKYEFHVLLQDNKRCLIDFIFSADQVTFKRNKVGNCSLFANPAE
ncbi:DUF4085 family protein [Paenibacillus gallinarum]|uniref:DUF4085 family protein n=1 Tax=Paenibacillus gallinarum TaxID=2762232 RepID=A0ABR8T6J2_9BACL|nr:DUF4085 family protein [Paenibacillus gallinarum]MBD7971394.1 DUF4085 family protein [Paenibacillus gallinarum]